MGAGQTLMGYGIGYVAGKISNMGYVVEYVASNISNF